MASAASTPSLTPSRSPSPPPIVQPDHFYGSDSPQILYSHGKSWLDPADDPSCARGIPVFKPTMEEFRDFEAYMNRVECWGRLSGIVKVIPPKEWTDSLPSVKPQLAQVEIRSPIEQHMLGRAGLFRQQNMEKKKVMSVREWVELTRKEEYRAPAVDEVLHARHMNVQRKTRKKKGAAKAETADPESIVKDEPVDQIMVVEHGDAAAQMPITLDPVDPRIKSEDSVTAVPANKAKAKAKGKRSPSAREAKEASLNQKLAKDEAFLETFEPHVDWLPPNTARDDYTPDFCRELERRFWRNCGLAKPAWYGADTQGSLYTDETTVWNVAHLESTLTRILPASIPGVNSPYLYWGMWRATFAWHVEDMDLFSINYIHFGAPKFWYAVPQARAAALEETMRGYFPKDTSQCSQFLRHKSFLVSPNLLQSSACKPNICVQQAGEFMITFPRGYHAGFNLGLNCAESVNFALDSWIELGRKAEACKCIPDSVRIDVDQLLRVNEIEIEEEPLAPPPIQSPAKPPSPRARQVVKVKKEPTLVVPLPPKSSPSKRKATGGDEPAAKKIKIKLIPGHQNVIPKLTAAVVAEVFPCCLCISPSKENLLRVYDPPVGRKEAVEAAGDPEVWMAHETCAMTIPETWVDELDIDANGRKEKVVFGVDGIVKDRWNLKCAHCTRPRAKAHGAPIQCTKGKCSKAFHISCAAEENTIRFNVLREVEKEVVLVDPVDPNVMLVDNPNSRFLKVIKKIEYELLCTQHNPAVTAARKASKQDRIKNELLKLPPMARIKLRVSAGVFEVSLIRVIEETCSVEVLWDRGIKREFKWGSVLFGATDIPVQQKPCEMPPDAQGSSASVPSYPSVSAATASTPSSSSAQPHGFGANPASSNQWSYQSGQGGNHYPYGQYYNLTSYGQAYVPAPSTNPPAKPSVNYYPRAQHYPAAKTSETSPAPSQSLHSAQTGNAQLPTPDGSTSATPSIESTTQSAFPPAITTEQLTEMFQNNPALRDMVLATLQQQRIMTTTNPPDTVP